MTNREMFERNQQLSTAFDRHLLDHPELADDIHDGALVVLVPEFDKELARRNCTVARKSRSLGQPVMFTSTVSRRPACRG